jgi:hypothetical protein
MSELLSFPPSVSNTAGFQGGFDQKFSRDVGQQDRLCPSAGAGLRGGRAVNPVDGVAGINNAAG